MRLFLSLTVIVLCAFPCHHLHALTLDEAIKASLHHNASLQSQQSLLQATKTDIDTAYNGFRPSVNASYNRSLSHYDSAGRAFGYSGNITITQPLFSGGSSLDAIAGAKSSFAAAEAGLHATTHSIILETVTTYLAVLYHRYDVALQIKYEQTLQHHLNATQIKREAGTATQTDIAQAQTRLAQATTNRLRGTRSFESSKAQFTMLTGLNEDVASMALPHTLPEPPASLDQALSIAENNHPSIAQANHLIAVAEEEKNQLKSALYPTVYAEGRTTRGTSSRSTFDSDEDHVGIYVSMPLYQQGNEYTALRKQDHTIQNTRHQREHTSRLIRQYVTENWHNITSTTAEKRAAALGVQSAQLALNAIHIEHEHGTRTLLDVLDQENELLASQLNYMTARNNHVLATYNLLASIGTLSSTR